jgi:anti-anti-sigma regulatory factor
MSPEAPALELALRTWPALARTHLTARGSLGFSTRHQLLSAVQSAAEAGHHMSLDLSEIEAIDTGGVQAVRDCESLAGKRGAILDIHDPSPIVRQALRGPAER